MELAALLDIEILERTETRCGAGARDGPLKQPLGLVHGGVFATIADVLTDRGPSGLQPDELPAPDHRGARSTPLARRRHRGRTTAVWEVDITDDAGRLCALVRVTAAR